MVKAAADGMIWRLHEAEVAGWHSNSIPCDWKICMIILIILSKEKNKYRERRNPEMFYLM